MLRANFPRSRFAHGSTSRHCSLALAMTTGSKSINRKVPTLFASLEAYLSNIFSSLILHFAISAQAFKPLLPGRTQTFELSRHLSLSEREAKLQTELDDMRDVPSYARHDYQNDHDDEEEESVFLNLSIDVLAEAIFMGTELDRASDLHETLGSFVPRFWHHGVSDTVRAPQEGDTVRQLVLRGVKSPEIVATTAEEAPQGTVTRPRKTRAVAAPSQVAASETISIGFSKALYTKLGIEKIMNALDDSLLPTSSIIGYLITLHGGILHMSYPPTLDELVLYCHVYHLHQTLGTCGGLVEQTLFQVLFSLSWFPGFGVVAIGTLNELMRRLFLDTSANENLIQAVGSLYQTKEQYVQLLRHLGPLVIEYPEKVVLLLMEKPKRSISAPVARMEAPSFEMTGNLKP